MVSPPHYPTSAQERATSRTFDPSGGRSLRWPHGSSRWTLRLHAVLNRHAWEVRKVSDSNVRSWGACRPRVRAHMHTRDTMCASMSFALPVRVRTDVPLADASRSQPSSLRDVGSLPHPWRLLRTTRCVRAPYCMHLRGCSGGRGHYYSPWCIIVLCVTHPRLD